jgi:hypothetical protein
MRFDFPSNTRQSPSNGDRNAPYPYCMADQCLRGLDFAIEIIPQSAAPCLPCSKTTRPTASREMMRWANKQRRKFVMAVRWPFFCTITVPIRPLQSATFSAVKLGGSQSGQRTTKRRE